MNEARGCIESIFANWHSRKCGKPAGLGRGGNYCKTHALSHPSGDEPVLGSLWGIGRGQVPEEIEYIRRTAKTIVDTRGRRRNIDGSAFFDTRDECVAFIHERLVSQLERATELRDRLTDDLAEFRDREGL